MVERGLLGRPGEEVRGQLSRAGPGHVVRLFPETGGAILTAEPELDPPTSVAGPGEGDREVHPIESFRPGGVGGKQAQPNGIARTGPAIGGVASDEGSHLSERADPDIRTTNHRR